MVPSSTGQYDEPTPVRSSKKLESNLYVSKKLLILFACWLGSALTCSGAYFLPGDCVASVVLKLASLISRTSPALPQVCTRIQHGSSTCSRTQARQDRAVPRHTTDGRGRPHRTCHDSFAVLRCGVTSSTCSRRDDWCGTRFG